MCNRFCGLTPAARCYRSFAAIPNKRFCTVKMLHSVALQGWWVGWFWTSQGGAALCPGLCCHAPSGAKSVFRLVYNNGASRPRQRLCRTSGAEKSQLQNLRIRVKMRKLIFLPPLTKQNVINCAYNKTAASFEFQTVINVGLFGLERNSHRFANSSERVGGNLNGVIK